MEVECSSKVAGMCIFFLCNCILPSFLCTVSTKSAGLRDHLYAIPQISSPLTVQIKVHGKLTVSRRIQIPYTGPPYRAIPFYHPRASHVTVD